MNDSADIKMATTRLRTALDSLEGKLGPIATRITQLQSAAQESESFKTDRAELAAKLDSAQAREASFTEREVEFNTLADATTRELDAVISQVKRALAEGSH